MIEHLDHRLRPDPIFILAPPRSGARLLFDALRRSPGLGWVQGDAHAPVESVPGWAPAQRGWDSNRLSRIDVDPQRAEALRRAYAGVLGRPGDPAHPPGQALRLIEQQAKQALRVPMLDAVFPQARFVLLYRDLRETLASMLEAWRSGRFVTYPELPGWRGLPWSLPLIPGWRELDGRPLVEVVAAQWRSCMQTLLADLQTLPADRWCVADLHRLWQPGPELARLRAFLQLPEDGIAAEAITVDHIVPPMEERWQQHAEDLAPVVAALSPLVEQVRQRFAHPPEIVPTPVAAASSIPTVLRADLRSQCSDSFAPLLEHLGGSVLLSTYQSGRVVILRSDRGQLNTHFRCFAGPMGLALGAQGLAIGERGRIRFFVDQPALGHKLPPPGRHDACFVPRRSHHTGDVRVHELAWAGAELVFVATRFSCLARLDPQHSFVATWRPPFITAFAAEDRCHLNGLCVVDGEVRYASALGVSDRPEGWRERKLDGGVLLQVPSGEVLSAGLCMPHSPRWHQGRLWLLDSGRGELVVVDPVDGRRETVARLPGFARGLALVGPYALIGLSQVREAVFAGLPLERGERHCGVWAVDLRSGRTVAFVRFSGDVQEIFDVQWLPGLRFPELLEPADPALLDAFVLPEAMLDGAGG